MPIPAWSTSPAIIFDIDGTLVRPGSSLQNVHMGAMADAIADVTGRPADIAMRAGELHCGGVPLTGFTDAGTICLALRQAGLADHECRKLVPRVVRRMVERLGPAPGSADLDLLPGAVPVVAGLLARGFTMGLSTGNARAVARWKLSRSRVAALVDVGGFGDREVDRRGVVRAAVADVRTARCVLVGDTPADVFAAAAAGVPCVAVASGATPGGELAEAGAFAVLDGLSDAMALEVLVEAARQAPMGAEPLGARDMLTY